MPCYSLQRGLGALQQSQEGLLDMGVMNTGSQLSTLKVGPSCARGAVVGHSAGPSWSRVCSSRLDGRVGGLWQEGDFL